MQHVHCGVRVGTELRPVQGLTSTCMGVSNAHDKELCVQTAATKATSCSTVTVQEHPAVIVHGQV